MATKTYTTLTCSATCTLSVSKEGNVYTFGSHLLGAHGDTEANYTPKMLPNLKNILAIDCGSYFTICLDEFGCLYSFGSNGNGQLGIGKDKEELSHTHIPQKISDIPPIRQFSCGDDSTLCVTENSEVYGFGSNNYSQLGLDASQWVYSYPQKLTTLEDIDFVECGSMFAVCKSLSDEIFVWGYNFTGQLGIQCTENIKLPYKAHHWPKNVVDIKCGYSHTLVLTSNQEVYSCGNNRLSQLGRETDSTCCSSSLVKIPELSDIVRVEVGFGLSMCVDNNNNLYIFGYNDKGQLGLGDDKVNKHTPIKHPSLSNVIDISSSGKHSLVKTLSNEIFGFGDNTFAQLGIITEDKNQTLPIQVLIGNEDIWSLNFFNSSRAKSARK